jgi:hypothetical protein
VGVTAQYEDGEEFIQRNACGELEIAEKDDDVFKWYDLEMQFVQIDPEGLTLLTPARALTDGDDNVKGFAYGKSTEVSHFSLELWTKVTPQICVTGGNPEWFYFAFPHVANGTLTDFTFEDGPLTLTVNAHTRDAGALWGVGPSLVLDASSPAISDDHVLGFITDVQPPDPVCGLQAYTPA